MYYLLSIKHSDSDTLCWWRPDNCGYTCYLETAGKYTQKQIDEKPKYYKNGDGAWPVLCEEAEKLSHQVVGAEYLYNFKEEVKKENTK